MGLNESTHERKTFIGIVNGQFTKRVQEGTEKAVEREIEYPKGTPKRMIWERLYGSLDGAIAALEIKEGGEFGDQLLISMDDVGETFVVTLGMKSREAKGFMMCLPNIDLSKSVHLQPYNYVRKKDDKKMIGLGISYTGQKENIPFFYNKENGMPWGGEEKVDKDEWESLMLQQTIFLKKKTKVFIVEKFGTVQKSAEEKTVSQSGGSNDAPKSEIANRNEPDDLPFRMEKNYFILPF